MKVAILGNGGIAPVYKEAVGMIPNASCKIIDIASGADIKINSLSDICHEIYNYDIGVVCIPNFLHRSGAVFLLENKVKRVLIEKPGLQFAYEWQDLKDLYKNQKIELVKNNLFNNIIINAVNNTKLTDVREIKIKWLNKDRIPSPGSWFTERSKSFGGVSADLMPHLLTMMYSFNQNTDYKIDTLIKKQTKQLHEITKTSYGKINYDGVMNVDTYASLTTEIYGVKYNLEASWDNDIDVKEIEVIYKDGKIVKYPFDLCPVDAYSLMLQNTKNNQFLDIKILETLEMFQQYNIYDRKNNYMEEDNYE